MQLKSEFSKMSKILEKDYKLNLAQLKDKYPEIPEERLKEQLKMKARPKKEKQSKEEMEFDNLQTFAKFGVDKEFLKNFVSNLKSNKKSLTKEEEINTSLMLKHIQTSIAKLEEIQAVYTREDILKFAMKFGLQSDKNKTIFTHNDYKKIFNEMLKQGLLVQLADNQYSTKEMIATEKFIIDTIKNTKDKLTKKFENEIDISHFLSENFATMTDEQRDMFEFIINSKDQFVAVQGDAGTGKTYSLTALNQFLKEANPQTQILGMSFTGKAAEGLESETAINSSTIHKFLANEAKRDDDTPQNKNRILVIDEAGMLSAQHTKELMQIALKNNDKIVFVGDTEQLASVGAGNSFLNMQKNGIATTYLSKTMRQKTQETKELVSLIKSKDFEKVFKEITKQTTYLSKLKNDITENKSLKLTDIRAKVNALDDEVKKLNKAIEGLRSNEAFESVQKDLINIETELESLRIRQKALKYEIKKIQSLPKPESISKTEISILYNQFKQGLGDLIEKSLSDLEKFKTKIDSFRNNIVNKKLEKLTIELNQTGLKIREKDKKYSEILKTIDNGKILKNLKTGLSVYNKKSEELNKIRYQMTAFDEADRHKKNVLKPKLDDLKLDINKQIADNDKIIKSFEQTILEIHEIIMDNKEASFYINTKKSSQSKNYIDFEMRIFDDGSHSVDRTKVFIYDMALMFNEYTKKKHPRLLIHDNIFDVDQDTLVQSLNYLAKQEELYPNDFQYILTLNRDKIENEERQNLINLDINSHRKANFTKDNRFLGIVYKEK